MPRFFQDLKLAQLDGQYAKFSRSLNKTQLLIFDDWLRDPLSIADTQNLLDILDDHYNRSATMLVSQYPVDQWHVRFPEPTLADAILDRLVHNAYRVKLLGASQRKLRSLYIFIVQLIYNVLISFAALSSGRLFSESLAIFSEICKHPKLNYNADYSTILYTLLESRINSLS